jgi:hypothetical protein
MDSFERYIRDIAAALAAYGRHNGVQTSLDI